MSKEVAWYAQGLDIGFEAVRASGLLALNTILEVQVVQVVQVVQAVLEGNDAGFRRTPGTVLVNEQTGATVYTSPPPQRVPGLMADLERYMHEQSDLDALVRMAVIHHRFETIQPFYDGNGRTGRIVNILFLVKAGLLDLPILYLSRYISQTKQRYYRELQVVRDSGEWESWLLYMIKGGSETARHTYALVASIGQLLQHHKHYIREHYRFYSQDLINKIFRHPYTKVVFVQQDLAVSRATATCYLDALVDGDILDKHRLGRENYYANRELVDLLFEMPPMDV